MVIVQQGSCPGSFTNDQFSIRSFGKRTLLEKVGDKGCDKGPGLEGSASGLTDIAYPPILYAAVQTKG